MTSTLSRQLWYHWPLFFDLEKDLNDADVKEKIIKITVPKNTNCNLLDVGKNGLIRLQMAAHYNSRIKGVVLCRQRDNVEMNQKHDIFPMVEHKETELLQYRSAPKFDLIYCCEWLARIPAIKRKNILQYCRMLLKPGGKIVSVVTRKATSSTLHATQLQELMKTAGLYPIHTRRLTGTLHVITGQRPRTRYGN